MSLHWFGVPMHTTSGRKLCNLTQYAFTPLYSSGGRVWCNTLFWLVIAVAQDNFVILSYDWTQSIYACTLSFHWWKSMMQCVLLIGHNQFMLITPKIKQMYNSVLLIQCPEVHRSGIPKMVVLLWILWKRIRNNWTDRRTETLSSQIIAPWTHSSDSHSVGISSLHWVFLYIVPRPC